MVKTLRRLLPLVCLAACGAAQADGLQVLHWWKSASERKAVDLVAARLNDEGIAWRDGMIPNGSGVGAGIVLRSRMLAKDAPEVAQVNGIVIRDWARLGLLLDLDAVAAAGKWDKLLQPTVAAAIQSDGHVYAAPLGIHRINTLFYNRKLFSQFKLNPPTTWAEFEHAASVLQQGGVVPLAQSSEPWQVATLFETLVLSEGAEFYRALFQRRDAAAYADPKLASALTRLRHLKKWMDQPVPERTWDEATRELADGNAAMLVMGDWAKGELVTRGLAVDDGFGCAVVPGTASYHLYNIDTLSMLATREPHRPAQEKLAALIMTPSLQNDYNQVKGSIPVLRNPALAKMDSCARASYKLFSSGPGAQIPSLVHRMATDEIVRDAMVAELHRYFLDDGASVADTQRRLAAIARTYTKTH
ncbi:MAG TPA: ABC transporter substrate-binding protein [Burkholderiaceae bacterium]|nr:ABC transporter substrate-binding protein [Burkholderiaceae bacterium]